MTRKNTGLTHQVVSSTPQSSLDDQRRLTSDLAHIFQLKGRVPNEELPKRYHVPKDDTPIKEPALLIVLNWLSQCLVRAKSGDVIATAFEKAQEDHSFTLHIFTNRSKYEMKADAPRPSAQSSVHDDSIQEHTTDGWPAPIVKVMCAAIKDLLMKPSRTFTSDELDKYTERLVDIAITIAGKRIKNKLYRIRYCAKSGVRYLSLKSEPSETEQEKVQKIFNVAVDSWKPLFTNTPNKPTYILSGGSGKAYWAWKIPEALQDAEYYTQDVIDKANHYVAQTAHDIAKTAIFKAISRERRGSINSIGSDSSGTEGSDSSSGSIWFEAAGQRVQFNGDILYHFGMYAACLDST
ncbi:hypothetical protein IW261DRAFT_1418306 [Armillaria novae-zelandiae]|uniref:Uncharacterized protein n=1 Tax=Armillaria novae-zelandiae TaxID=153914 RepID=A0AA39PEH8_9AGAR|nr:hypothetical protein IW261DRAFT_1418306 [Armillaria novae-zelandiae]